MFSSSQNAEEDHLYDFNTNIDMGVAPGTSAGGYNKGPNANLKSNAAGGRPLMSSMGRANAPMSRAGLTTGQAGGGMGEARPMTSVSGAGYKGGNSKDSKGAFDPLNVVGKGPAPPLAEKSENSPEDKAKEMERKVHRLIEASAVAVVAKDMLGALEKAKEAGKAERALCKFRESKGLAEQINLDLTYAICFNLANAYYHNKMYEEALNTYQLIVKNKSYPQSGRLRVNMGNIYYEQKKFPQAIKMYRMALDQIPSTGKELRYRISRNIGNSFVKLGQFQDAIEAYDSVMAGSADIQTAFNLMLCLYARGDKEKIRRHFVKMLSIPIPGMTDDDEERAKGGGADDGTGEDGAHSDKLDALKEELARKLELSNERILTVARLIAPVVDDKDDWEAGYKWVVEQLRVDYESVCSNFEIELSMAYMKKRRFEDAVTVLKAFERKDMALRAIASTNLSFIYFLEGDYAAADKQADVAIKSDRYNAKALVNKGNCLFMAGELGRAREMYLEAVGVEADCHQAVYNLGLVNLKLNNMQEAQSAFDKLHTSVSSMPEALYQLGAIYERGASAEDLENAAKTFQLLLNKVPNDPGLCQKLGQIYEKLQDDNTACHWHTEAHRHFPVNLTVLSWLGVWYVKREMYDQAIEYFERASVVQPDEVKWKLMITSCHRRLGDSNKAYELYQKIHEEHPDNPEALQYLEGLGREMGRNTDEYARKLDKLRRSNPQPQNTQAAAGMTRAGGATTQAAPKNERQARPERSERPAATSAGTGGGSTTRALDDFPDSAGPARSPIAAPRAGSSRAPAPQRASAKASRDDEDEFGDTDVGSLL